MAKKKVFISLLVGSALIISFLLYCLIFTAVGARAIARIVISRYADFAGIKVEKIEGSLHKTVRLINITAYSIKGLPEETKVDIQKVEVSLKPFNVKNPNIKIFNGKMLLPSSDAVLFYGNYQNGVFASNLFCRHLNLTDIRLLFSANRELSQMTGYLNDIDINIGGSFSEFKAEASFSIERLFRDKFSLIDCPVNVSLDIKNIMKNPQVFGEAAFKKGVLSGPKTAVINLKESKILFSGFFHEPYLNFSGTSQVEKVKIDIELKGTFNNPDLRLSSQPYLGQGRLLLMLATNKAWQETEKSIRDEEFSAGMAREFLNYLVLSGSGSNLAQKLGLTDFSLMYDEDVKGFEVKKAIDGQTSASYSMEQRQNQNEEDTRTSHTVGAEHKITESIKIDVEKEIVPDDSAEQGPEKRESNDKIMLKFEKEF